MKKIKLWLVIAASAMLLSACGQDQDDTGSPIILDGEPISTEAAPSTEVANQETAAPGASEDATLPPEKEWYAAVSPMNGWTKKWQIRALLP